MIVEDEKKKILVMQRDLMNEVMNYQIEYGVGSVAWNISVQFIEKRSE
jgi:hypothetical protein